jgi:alpha-L-rhamnosidase
MAEIASILGKNDDSEEFSALAADIRTAFCKTFINSDGRLTETSQTAALMTLQFDLAPESYR